MKPNSETYFLTRFIFDTLFRTFPTRNKVIVLLLFSRNKYFSFAPTLSGSRPVFFGRIIPTTHSNIIAMKIKLPLFALLGIAALTLFSSCLRDTCSSSHTYVRFDPVYKTLAECRVPISAEQPRTLKKPGKIYTIGDYLLITEIGEGIHVFNNSNPANPVPVIFWNIPGNVDMAVRDHFLYADQYIDLLTIDISDVLQPQLVCRAENVFSLMGFDPTRGYLVDYVQTQVTQEVSCNDQRWGNVWFMEGDAVFLPTSNLSQSNGPIRKNAGLPGGTGIAGSYSRFGQYGDYLYCVDNSSLRPFSLATPGCPSSLPVLQIGWNIETIFPWNDRLFVGSQTGVFIFNASNPAQPVLESTFSHASGCDPVVCDDENAYITIHDGTECNNGVSTAVNQLEVVDIRNLPAATLRKSYAMTKPKGLSIAGKYLYLCDDGLKIFDKSNPLEMKELAHIRTIQTYDIIALDDTHILVVGDGGFFQYDVSNPAEPKQISHIAVAP